ncbi:hypothetical protein KKA39_02615 [Patescibacteria group bacterium]|nr:hypothetical protein [Patescibacteria group bacterium]MBU1728169.1 hypothetical protein [Patescibacteria group bacterium]
MANTANRKTEESELLKTKSSDEKYWRLDQDPEYPQYADWAMRKAIEDPGKESRNPSAFE